MTIDYSSYKYAESFIGYFEENIESNPLFRPELETAKSVVEIMEQSKHTIEDLQEIHEAMSLIETHEHYIPPQTSQHIHETIIR